VAAQAHQKGSKKSANNPSRMNAIQKIFRSISRLYVSGQNG
jgi:hypothetical protein